MTGFEPATPRTPCVYATRLRHIPNLNVQINSLISYFQSFCLKFSAAIRVYIFKDFIFSRYAKNTEFPVADFRLGKALIFVNLCSSPQNLYEKWILPLVAPFKFLLLL